MRSSAIIATVVASATMAVATPSATVNNHCDFPVYLWSVADTQGPTQTLHPGGSFTEEYQTKSDGSGCSIKMSPKDDPAGEITQFEYTYTPNSVFGGIFYDISNINGEPFQDILTQLVPQLNGAQNTSSCSTVDCPKGQKKCVGAYNVWNDDFATHSCPQGTSLTFNLCDPNSVSSSNSGSNSDSNSSPAAQSPAPAPETPTPTPVAESPAPAPETPTPTPIAAPAPVATTVQKVQSQAASPTPVPVAAAPLSGSAFALQWAEGDSRIGEGKVSKREAHANHMERHQRIRRMHHARSAI